MFSSLDAGFSPNQNPAGNPLDVLATNFGVPAEVFKKFPHGDVFVTK